jgi:hypothetical protein
MLAAPIWIDRLIKTDIGRVVAGNDGTAGIDGDLGGNARGRSFLEPAVIDWFRVLAVEPVGGI